MMKYTSVICVGLLTLSLGVFSSPALAVKVEMGSQTKMVSEPVVSSEPIASPDMEKTVTGIAQDKNVDAGPEETVLSSDTSEAEEEGGIAHKADVSNDPVDTDKADLKQDSHLKKTIIEALVGDGMPLLVPKSDKDIQVMKANERFAEDMENGWVIFPEWSHLSVVQDNQFVIPFVYGLSDTDVFYYISLLEYDEEYGAVIFLEAFEIGKNVADLLVKTKEDVVHISYKDVSAGTDQPVEKNLALKLYGPNFIMAE